MGAHGGRTVPYLCPCWGEEARMSPWVLVLLVCGVIEQLGAFAQGPA